MISLIIWYLKSHLPFLQNQIAFFFFNDNYLPTKLTYLRDGLWLKIIGYSNFLCIRATRAIINHAPIWEYCLRFFLKKNFSCLYRVYPIESRHHILQKYRRYNNYWNSNRNSLLLCHIPWIKFRSVVLSWRSHVIIVLLLSSYLASSSSTYNFPLFLFFFFFFLFFLLFFSIYILTL